MLSFSANIRLTSTFEYDGSGLELSADEGRNTSPISTTMITKFNAPPTARREAGQETSCELTQRKQLAVPSISERHLAHWWASGPVHNMSLRGSFHLNTNMGRHHLLTNMLLRGSSFTHQHVTPRKLIYSSNVTPREHDSLPRTSSTAAYCYLTCSDFTSLAVAPLLPRHLAHRWAPGPFATCRHWAERHSLAQTLPLAAHCHLACSDFHLPTGFDIFLSGPGFLLRRFHIVSAQHLMTSNVY